MRLNFYVNCEPVKGYTVIQFDMQTNKFRTFELHQTDTIIRVTKGIFGEMKYGYAKISDVGGPMEVSGYEVDYTLKNIKETKSNDSPHFSTDNKIKYNCARYC